MVKCGVTVSTSCLFVFYSEYRATPYQRSGSLKICRTKEVISETKIIILFYIRKLKLVQVHVVFTHGIDLAPPDHFSTIHHAPYLCLSRHTPTALHGSSGGRCDTFICLRIEQIEWLR